MDQTAESVRILLVEDNSHDRLIFLRAMKNGPITGRVTECECAADAVDMLESDAASFDVIVTDYDLPGLSGIDFCKKVLDAGIDVPLVLMTGAGSEELAVRALKMGVYDYVVKHAGSSYQDLLQVVIGEVLQRHREKQARKRAEIALEQANEELEQRVQQRTEDLLAANARLEQEIKERRLAETRIRENLQEKEILLKEIHHRVKNNLMVITSLLRLQSRKIGDKEQAIAAFEESRDRIVSMAVVHEILYKSDDFSKIDQNRYIKTMVNNLKGIYDIKCSTNVLYDIDDVPLNINISIPFGLILNELITNAFKHAFDGRPGGEIHIAYKAVNDTCCRLTVRDNGAGFPDGIDLKGTDSFGLQLVTILTEQLHGTLSVDGSAGACFSLEFPQDTSDASCCR
ncbi:response regulator [bacterium]|nr:response regulator [bacterium]